MILGGGVVINLMKVGWECRRDGSGLIAHDFLESEILAYLGWVLIAGIIELGWGGGSVYWARIGRGCLLLG